MVMESSLIVTKCVRRKNMDWKDLKVISEALNRMFANGIPEMEDFEEDGTE